MERIFSLAPGACAIQPIRERCGSGGCVDVDTDADADAASGIDCGGRVVDSNDGAGDHGEAALGAAVDMAVDAFVPDAAGCRAATGALADNACCTRYASARGKCDRHMAAAR